MTIRDEAHQILAERYIRKFFDNLTDENWAVLRTCRADWDGLPPGAGLYEVFALVERIQAVLGLPSDGRYGTPETYGLAPTPAHGRTVCHFAAWVQAYCIDAQLERTTAAMCGAQEEELAAIEVKLHWGYLLSSKLSVNQEQPVC